MESALAAWFKQVCENNASIDGNHLKEKASHIAPHPGIANFRWMKQQINNSHFVYRTLIK
jgi:hypothetical protein